MKNGLVTSLIANVVFEFWKTSGPWFGLASVVLACGGVVFVKELLGRRHDGEFSPEEHDAVGWPGRQ